jgi:hypothetical protein
MIAIPRTARCTHAGIPASATRNLEDFAHTGVELVDPWDAP